MSKIPDIEIVYFNGSYDSRIERPGSQYYTITYNEMIGRVKEPTSMEKLYAPAIVPSSYREYDARNHKTQREKGFFHFLCIDIDTGSHSLQTVKDAVTKIIGSCATIIYSTASSSPENMKWRVIIPLDKPVLGSKYTATQSALFDMLAKEGIECDRSLDRTGQPIYLPNIPNDRRDYTLKGAPPLFYQYAILDGGALDVNNTAIPALREAKESEEKERFQKKIEEANQRQSLSDLMGFTGAVSQIDIYNRENPLDKVLERYGYTYGGNDNWRSPHQQGKTFATKVYGTKWFSLSTSDGDLGRPANSGGRFGSAFDLYVHYEHSGDLKGALRALECKHQNILIAAVRADSKNVVAEISRLNATELHSLTNDDSPIDVNNTNASKGTTELAKTNEIEQQRDKIQRFEEALAELKINPNLKNLQNRAIHCYADLDAIDKIIAEDQLMKATGLNKTTLRSAAKEASAATNGPSDLTHSEIADIFLKGYHLQSNPPIGNSGSIFFYEESGIWKRKSLPEIEVEIGRKFRSQKNSKRANDYNGIAKLVYTVTENTEFFKPLLKTEWVRALAR